MAYLFLAPFLLNGQDDAPPPPAVTALSVVSGTPGTRVDAQITSTVTFPGNAYLVVSFPDGSLAPAPATTLADGQLTIIVPYVIDETDPRGYRTGTCSLGVLDDSGAFTEGWISKFSSFPRSPTRSTNFAKS